MARSERFSVFHSILPRAFSVKLRNHWTPFRLGRNVAIAACCNGGGIWRQMAVALAVVWLIRGRGGTACAWFWFEPAN